MHFFGSKDGLFDAALRGAMPIQELASVLAGEVSSLGVRLTRRYLEVWESPETGPRIRAIVGSIATTPAAAQIMRDFMSGALAAPWPRASPATIPTAARSWPPPSSWAWPSPATSWPSSPWRA